MEILSIADAEKKIQLYLKNQNNFRPYFVISDDTEKSKELKNFFNNSFEELFISDFCSDDSPLDTDSLVEKFKTLKNNSFCFGLGEYIYFTEQKNILRMLQDKTFDKKIIFFCRGIANLLERLADEDKKFLANNICRVQGKSKIFAVKYNPNMNIETDAKNFSELLKSAENGKKNFVTFNSRLPLVNVKEINSFYDAIKNKEPNFNFSSDALTENQWREYFFDDKCENYPPEHWRSFAAGFKNQISDSYLKNIFARSANYEEYRKNLFFALLDVDDEKNFEEYYLKRKSAVKNISAEYISEYLERLENFSDSEKLKYLTDNTAEERRAMIKAVQGKEKIPNLFKKNFPAMNDYLSDYDFADEEIKKYFRRYKKIKLCNIDDENFKNDVQKFSLERPYNKFQTRQEILDRADKNSKLYWLDALGVEFLSYIKIQAGRMKLSAKIEIARANLPTVTSQNKNFYDEWQGEKFDKNQNLDELKHSPEKFDANKKCSAPIYIDEELKIIDKVLEEIKNFLFNHRAEKIILTSDHGASRLAVMYGRENKYKMNSVGEHSGRCCPVNELDEKPTCATEENGWLILANYDRFSGGRLSSVEVHGGATLEEILVPVIEFSLTEEKNKIKNPPKEKIPKPTKKIDDSFDFFE